MLNLPQSTEYNKRIPKQKFYENLTVTAALKRIFIDQIKVVYWRNKIAATTMNLAAGETVTEIEVFEIRLSAPQLDVSVLKQIDKEIPYHILFLLEYEGKYQVWTAYKEQTVSGSHAFKVGTYYHTAWLPEEDLPLRVDGLTMDAVYENFVRQIAGEVLTDDDGISLKEAIEQSEGKQKIQKEIERLEKMARAEKQPKRKFELVQKIQILSERAKKK